MDYQAFLKTKRVISHHEGIAVTDSDINPTLFPFQRDTVRWSLSKGRAAMFLMTGLGKTFCQLEFARLTGGTSLIVAPLSVAKQTISEGEKLGLDVRYARTGDDVSGRLNITNYEMIDKFNPADFDCVVLDESSVLKQLAGKRRQLLTEMFCDTRFRLCCTATPAPNDIAEMGNHAEFLGIMPRVDMLSMFFVHDDTEWRLKRHAEIPFYRWLASWSISLKKPSDLGYDDDGFILPPMSIEPSFVETGYIPDGFLFPTKLGGITGRSEVRGATIGERCAAAAKLVNGSDEQWIVWCGLNDESKLLASLIPDAVEVKGADSIESKVQSIEAFREGKIRAIVTKGKILGFGMNFQNCRNMVFVGLNDSWELYFQCIRRCYRFGQSRPVNVHIVLSVAEQEIYENIMAKERMATKMTDSLIGNVAEFEKQELSQSNESDYEYETGDQQGLDWRMMLGDSSERMKEIESDSVGLSVFSPPFASLYTYSATERDLGNSASSDEFLNHFGFIVDELMRVAAPGRNVCVHCSQIPAMLSRDGWIGLKDFRGDLIRLFVSHGFIYHGDVCIQKNPQAQAIRTHSKALLFNQLRKDATWSRPALADYVLVFRKPGENAVPVLPELTNDQWVEWASPIWLGISESDTLQYTVARGEKDERHICPLQLGVIERCVKLWSNPGDLVCSPFAGIGSEGYVAIRENRQFVGIELKPEYYNVAVQNLKEAEATKGQLLF